MRLKAVAVAAAIAACSAFAPQMTTATALPGATMPHSESVAGSLVTDVHYRQRCARWRAECAARWGWRTWRFRRCLIRRGC